MTKLCAGCDHDDLCITMLVGKCKDFVPRGCVSVWDERDVLIVWPWHRWKNDKNKRR